MVKHLQFPNLQATTFFFLFLVFECFNLGIGTIISLDIFRPQQIEISNVCVLPGKHNTYGEKLVVYGYSLMKRQPLEHNNNVSSKKTIQWAFPRVWQAN